MGESPSLTPSSAAFEHDDTKIVPLSSSPEPPALESTTPAPAPGQAIGRYLVIEQLGQGGMGVVLRAYDPKLQREVALKCLRPGMLSTDTQARMVREAQAMAKLSHRNVVCIYDVELLQDQVVLAMEFVQGVTLRAWLELERRPWRAVVRAFIGAGRGLQAAHEAGLLHRDFKPDNVLIAKDDEPKVTDFGIAHIHGSVQGPASGSFAAAERDGDTSMSTARLTRAGLVMGTPVFMAPEQHDGGTLTPAIDQYAFCISLWQGLTGQFPFVGSAKERVRRKRRGPPAWPKTAANVPRPIVDAIVRGLAPDPTARWPSMAALLVELGFDPTEQRRRRLVSGALATSVLGGAGWMAIDHALTTAACEDEGRTFDSTWNRDRAEAIASAFERTGLSYAVSTWQNARERVDLFANDWQRLRTQACLRGERDDQWDDEALARSRSCFDELRVRVDTLARYWQQPDPPTVDQTAVVAWGLPQPSACLDPAELARREVAADPAVFAAEQALRHRLAEASALRATGRYAEALVIVEEVLEAAQELERPHLVATTVLARGGLRLDLRQNEPARLDLQQAFGQAERIGDDSLALDAATRLISIDGSSSADHDDRLQWFWLAELKHARLRLSLEAPQVAASLNNIGNIYTDVGRPDEALAAHQRALSIREKLLGSDHPDVAASLNNIGNVHLSQERHDDALAVHSRALSIWERTLGSDHPRVAASLSNIGNVHRTLGRFDDARSAHARALSIREQALGSDHPDVAMSLANLGAVHAAQEHFDEALPLILRALSISETQLGPSHVDVGTLLLFLGQIHIGQRNPSRAVPLLERALDIFTTNHVSPRTRGEVRFVLAQALGPSPRAIEFVHQAWADGPPGSELRREAESWLCTHAPDEAADCPSPSRAAAD